MAALPAALVVAALAASCPASWSGPGASGGCFRITSEWSTHAGCAELCGPGAALACIGSEAENTYVAALVESYASQLGGLTVPVWLGNYHGGGAGGRAAWSACSSGEAVTYSNWEEGAPGRAARATTSMHGVCAAFSSDAYEWWPSRCTTQHHCLCELGGQTSAEYLAGPHMVHSHTVHLPLGALFC